MLLQNPVRVQIRCPGWLSPAAAVGLLSLAVLVSGVSLRAEAKNPAASDQLLLVVPPQEPPQTPTPPEPPPKKEKKKAPRALPRDEEIPSFEEQPEPRRQREEIDKLREQMMRFGRQAENEFLFQPGFGLASEGRLGILPQKLSPALADQLNLAENQGILIQEIREGSAAAKAGLKAHDILLEFNGKPVPGDADKLREMVDEVKANTPVDAVVLRKGKKETIKGITLAEAKNNSPFFRPGDGFNPPGLNPPAGFQRRGLGEGRGPIFSGFGRHHVMTTIFRDNDRFTTRHQEGSLVITITGIVKEGNAAVSQIEVLDGPKHETYNSVDKVPEQYRDKVKNLLDMNEKGTTKIEIRTPEKKKSGDKSKDRNGEEE